MITEGNLQKLRELLQEVQNLDNLTCKVNGEIRKIRSTCTHEYEPYEYLHTTWGQCMYCGQLQSPL